jgi:type II secretory pathway pseudopilin PulG
MTTRRRLARGYTIVELLMSLTVLAFGVSGVLAMQKVTVANNRHAKNLAIATRIAEAWADQLATDGMVWTVDQNGASTRDKTVWLKKADPSNIVDWYLPDYSAERGFGPAFGALGAPRATTSRPEQTQFCTHLRLAFLKSETLPTTGNGVIRAQVRVFYQREDAGLATLSTANLCSITDDATFRANLTQFHVVYLTTAIRQQQLGRVQ